MHILEILIFIYYISSIFEARFNKWAFPVAFLIIYWIPFEFIRTNWHTAWIRIPLSITCMFVLVYIFFKDKLTRKFIYILIYIACSIVMEMLLALFVTLFKFDISYMRDSSYANAMLQFFFVPLELTYAILIVKFSQKNIAPPSRKVLQNIALFIISQIIMYNVIIELYFYYKVNSLPMIILIIASIVFSMLFGILIYRSVASMYRQKQQDQSMFEQSMYQAEKYETLKTAYMDYHRLRHDFYDHISVMDSLKAAGNEEKLNDYITRMKADFEGLENIVFCENTAVDMLVGNKALTAREKGIKTEFSLKDTTACGIDDMDLCSIFSNLLNNAIRGSENYNGEKYITMKSYIRAGCFVVTCRNSSNMPDPDMNTTKADRDKHGFGIQIVKNISKKLGGNAVFEYNDGDFVSIVSIPVAL